MQERASAMQLYEAAILYRMLLFRGCTVFYSIRLDFISKLHLAVEVRT